MRSRQAAAQRPNADGEGTSRGGLGRGSKDAIGVNNEWIDGGGLGASRDDARFSLLEGLGPHEDGGGGTDGPVGGSDIGSIRASLLWSRFRGRSEA